MVPSKNLVVVFTGGGFEPGDVGKVLVSAVSDKNRLPENPDGIARLALATQRAARPPTATPPKALPVTAEKISGRIYHFDVNPLGLSSASFKFAAGVEAIVTLAFSDKRFTNKTNRARPVGLDGVLRISPGGRFGLPVGLRGFWESPDTFTLEYDEIANINCYYYRFTFDGQKLSLQLTEKTGTAKLSFKGRAKEHD